MDVIVAETHAEDIVDGAMQAVQVPENKIELILLDILPEAEESVDVDASPSECDSRYYSYFTS